MLAVNGLAPTTSSLVVIWLRANGLRTATIMLATMSMKMESMLREPVKSMEQHISSKVMENGLVKYL